jgi:hypothetical protein
MILLRRNLIIGAMAFIASPALAEQDQPSGDVCIVLPAPFHTACLRGDYAVIVMQDQREFFIPVDPNRPTQRTWGHVVDLRDI